MASNICIDNVTKQFNNQLVLSRVDLDLPKGSFTSLLGPSGCGKSTLLNMIAGFTEPTTGKILVDERSVSGPSADKGVVFQEYALFPWLTAAENVAFGPKIKALNRQSQRSISQKYLELVGLENYAGRFPKELSGGMKQRVAIARALANQPSVLLMDEPFGALDAQTRETLQDEIVSIWEQERKTIVFVTHSIAEAVFLSDRIVVMSSRPGSVKEVVEVKLSRPRDRMHADFVELTRHIKNIMH